MTAVVYSVQQIKFEFLSYIKEFGGDATTWRVGTADDARDGLFVVNGVDAAKDIWLWKPTLSKAAARMVFDWFTRQFHVRPAPHSVEGSQVFLYRLHEVPVGG